MENRSAQQNRAGPRNPDSGPFAVGAEIGHRALDLDDERSPVLPSARMSARRPLASGNSSEAGIAELRQRAADAARQQQGRDRRCAAPLTAPRGDADAGAPIIGNRAATKTSTDGRRSTMALSKRGFLRTAWNLAWPYWTGEEKWSARALLAAVVALNLIYGVAQRPPQRLEQRFLQRPAGIRLAGILVAVRDFRDDRRVAHRRRWSTSSTCGGSCKSAGGAG